MTTQAPPSNLLPLNPEQLARLQAATTDFSPTQLAWVSGYFWGMLNQQAGAVVAAPATAVETPAITLISASQTGNARRVAEALRDDLLAAKLHVNLVNAGDYKFKQIASEKLLVVVASTQGEGEPAEEAVALHKFLFSKKAPKLAALPLPCSAWAIPPMNSSASQVKILTANWRNWAQSACWTASTPMWNTRLRPLNGARVLLRC
jgi:sulfite reductase (NADPH) flavoprotein alpha-component